MRGASWLARLMIALPLAAWPSAVVAEGPGDPARGRAIFETKACSRCHLPQRQGAGPRLEEIQRPQGALELTGRLWNHAPSMFTLLKLEHRDWPEIGVGEMADLMAYLQATPARDPSPDLSQGQALLVKKECLKCHRFRGEGGSVGIELTKYPGYHSPVIWAASVWNHSPKMSALAPRTGLFYPRFTSAEMVNLFGFLKGAATPPEKRRP